MIQKTLPALLAACMFFPAISRAAEAEPALAIVTGLAPGDLLNVRADASPVGHTRTRLANGASVQNSGCGDFGGYQWCKVAVVDQPGVDGWVPARYLLAVDPEGTATPTLDEAEIKAGTHDASTPAGQGEAGGERAVSAAPAMPANLAARFGDGPSSATGGAQRPDTPAGLTPAETEAYRVAYAARAKAEAAARKDAGAEAGVPVPTPRPDPEGGEAAGMHPASSAVDDDAKAAEAPAPQVVALADPQSPARAWDATGEIPCARYVGQPMARCRVGIRREGGGRADVTVAWPDSGTRVIGFYEGKPAGADSPGEFRFTREGELNMIRIGASERFEITDTLAFGD
jgi:hypothetical protein